MYASLYRQILLPIHQGLRGRKTMRYWRDAQEKQWKSLEFLQQFQWDAFQRLIRHAEKNCKYYQSKWRELGLNTDSLKCLEDVQRLPLLQRSEFRKFRAEIRSEVQQGKTYAKSTGGSSGEPLHFELCRDSNDRRVAMTYRGYDWAGAGPGVKSILLWGASTKALSAMQRFKLDLHHRFDHQRWLNCFEFSPEDMRRYHHTLMDFRPQTIIAYTNPIYEFARFIEAEGLPVPPLHSIVIGAEKLHAFQRQKIEQVFGVRVFETYGSREFMLIGAECEEHAGLHLSMDNLLVEIVDDDGSPTPIGEVGNVVVTDLFNYAMPFIRYMTGDLATAGWRRCACGRGLPLLRAVQGRRLDMLQTVDGRRIPGEFFPHLMKDFESVVAFQVEQIELDKLIVRLQVKDGFHDSIRQQLCKSVEQVVGRETGIDWQEVDRIPLSPAGKRQVVINRLACPSPLT